ncbi:hypothetical protein [Uliginosibacterium gangwonense]|uniref:hypothetical protein n=1 Tax=Uliginosibacterium gangwonense TaxID=392736 RepID=UPI00037C0B93|nr:hypothetical protein [Uliginosibacterium gangwonense]
MMTPDDASKKAYDEAVKNGLNGRSDNPVLAANVDTVDIGAMLQGSEREEFSASCLADLSFSVNGHSIVVPMGEACKWMSYFGTVSVMISFVIGLIIIGKS